MSKNAACQHFTAFEKCLLIEGEALEVASMKMVSIDMIELLHYSLNKINQYFLCFDDCALVLSHINRLL